MIIASSITHGDGFGTLLNALALIHGYSDAAKDAQEEGSTLILYFDPEV